MKIAIIGKGTSSIIQACVCILNKHDVEIFYDPDIPPVSVGESTTPHFPNLINDALGYTMDQLIEQGLMSRKRSAAFINWGNGTPWIHGFGGHPPDANSGVGSFHFDTVILNKFLNDVLEERGIKYHAEKVYDLKDSGDHVMINDKQYDFVINCTGWNYDQTTSLTPAFHTVNAGFLHRDDDFEIYPGIISKDATVHKATEDGWEFNLPFPKQNVVRKGYLFNTNYISPEEVTHKLESRGKKGKVITWNPKRSKYMLESPRVAANGNRLFFVEPLQAYSILMYIEFASIICEYLTGNLSVTKIPQYNLKYERLMIQYEQELAFHYQYGSIFKDSKFWQDKTEEARRVTYYHPSAGIDTLSNIVSIGEIATNSIQRIFMHSREDLIYIHRWMTDTWTDEDKPKIRWSGNEFKY
jgi:hypothetical protein